MNQEIQVSEIQIVPVKPQDGLIAFAWQDMRVMKIIRNHYGEEKRTTAIAIYQSLTELASLAGRGQGKHVSQFTAYLITIAEKSGKSVSTIKRYTKEFRDLQILVWEKRRNGKMNMSSMWKLLDYRGSYSEPTSPNNSKPNPSVHNSGLPTEEDRRKLYNKKERFNKLNNNDGLKSMKDIMDEYGKNK